MTKSSDTDKASGVVGVAVVCALMLLWPLLGHPPYAYYSFMKLAVAGGSVYLAYTIWELNVRFAPLCLLLLVSGGIHLFAKMRKNEWVPFNWGAVILFACAATLIVLFLRRPNQEIDT
jgi:hypothetical protein